ncbi:helix-turn-helix transcriptional regulator [Metabacillus sp. FJAT-52054]|uniref:Helix-turn-helix transcriptional regulator n=1 Tax=Metabacillus sediminis TaxID=3117746 RepID=A0ABZ2NJ71_9BACI
MPKNNLEGVLEITGKMVIRGKTIKVLRTIKGHTLKDMRESTELTLPTLSAMENEKYNLSLRNQVKITRYLTKELGYTPDEVMVLQAFINSKR